MKLRVRGNLKLEIEGLMSPKETVGGCRASATVARLRLLRHNPQHPAIVGWPSPLLW